jgi:PAS domain-containing protein
MEISGSGEMAERIREFDWSQSSLGPQDSWSDSLFTAVNLILCAPVPMQLLWGPELVELYNDHMIPFMSGKHPQALGQPARECWSEAWPIVSAQLEQVLTKGKAVSFDEVLVPIEKNGKLEDVYWNYSYTPIHGPRGKIDGVLDITFDVTDSYLGKQRLRASEDRAVRILQSIGDAVIVTDADSAVTQMNPVAESLTGWTQQEAAGASISEVFNSTAERRRVSEPYGLDIQRWPENEY